MKNVIVVLSFLLVLTGCNKSSNKEQDTSQTTNGQASSQASDSTKIASPPVQPVPVGDNTQSSLDWNGTYTGDVMGDDKQIHTETLILTSDYIYERKQGPNDSTPIKGYFLFSKDGSYITLLDNKNNPINERPYYFIAEGRIFSVDKVGDRNFAPTKTLHKML